MRREQFPSDKLSDQSCLLKFVLTKVARRERNPRSNRKLTKPHIRWLIFNRILHFSPSSPQIHDNQRLRVQKADKVLAITIRDSPRVKQRALNIEPNSSQPVNLDVANATCHMHYSTQTAHSLIPTQLSARIRIYVPRVASFK